jgi:AcrR family transcriptional regulator
VDEVTRTRRVLAEQDDASTPPTPQRPSEARDRLLNTASGLFYTKGVHTVGVDEILSKAKVTRATFYRHFPSKDDLIVAYIRAADAGIRAAVAAATGGEADSKVRALANFVADQVRTPGFRGCAFLNAAAEYPDEDDPIRQAITAHRSWFHDTVLAAFREVTRDRAPQAADHFVMLRDGAMASGCLQDRETVVATFLHGVDGMLASFSEETPRRRAARKRT